MGTKRVGLARIEALMENLKRDLALGGATISGDLMKVEAKDASYSVSMPTDSGKFFTTTGASGVVTFTLPTVAGLTGCHCYFYNTVDQNMVIQCVDADEDLLVILNDAAADNLTFEQTNELIGAGIHAVCDGSKWCLMEVSAGSEAVTTTSDT